MSKTDLNIKYKYFSYVQRIFEWFNKFDKVLTRKTEFSLAFRREFIWQNFGVFLSGDVIAQEL